MCNGMSLLLSIYISANRARTCSVLMRRQMYWIYWFYCHLLIIDDSANNVVEHGS